MGVPSIRQLLCVVFIVWGLTGCAKEGLTLDDPWISEVPPNAAVQAGYLTIRNNLSQAATLVSADSVVFESIEIHRTVYDKATSVVKMVHEKQVEILSGMELRFEPGSYHLMLMKPKKALKEGDRVPMTIVFADGSKFKVEFAVRREAFRL